MRSIVVTDEQRKVLAGLLNNIGYEVMPFKTIVDKVVANVPTEIPLTVTATQAKGLETTLDKAITLQKKGYTVAPHVPARLVSGPEQLDTIVSRLEDEGITRIFIVGGDADKPAGEFHKAIDLLEALYSRGHHFDNIGIGGYPEGHGIYSNEDINQALRDKSPYANRILTQICFNAETFVQWGLRIKGEGVGLPIHVGMPGPVSRQKLMRISAGIGLGPSANFLKKQKNMFWRFFSPSGYDPTKLLKRLVQHRSIDQTMIAGLHINTFNDLVNTERWRRELLEQNKLKNSSDKGVFLNT